MSTIGAIEQAGFRRIADLKYAVKRTWESACKHDGIDPAASFVVFSDDNPYKPFCQLAMQEYLEAKRNHVPGGGYVGLTIKNGKATL